MAIIQTSEFSELYEKYLQVQQFRNKEAIMANAILAKTKLRNIKAEHDDNKPVSLLELQMYVDLYNFWTLQLNESEITVEQVLDGSAQWISGRKEEKLLPIAIVLAPGIKELPIKELIGLFYGGEIIVFYGLDKLVERLVAGAKFAGIITLHSPSTFPMATAGLLVRILAAYLKFCAATGLNEAQRTCLPSSKNCKNIIYVGPRSLALLIEQIEKMAKGE